MEESKRPDKEIYAATSATFKEQTEKRLSLDPDSFFEPWNPDDLVRKRADFSLYEEMLKDDQVNVALSLKKDLVLAGGFDFIPGESDQDDIVDDLNVALREDPDWSFDEMLEEILSAYEFGLSVSEKLFATREDGSMTLRHIKTRHPGPWLFHQDQAGNIERYEQQGVSGDIDPKSLIHYVNRRKFQNPYGISDLRAAYNAWFIKKHITRWYAIFIEKAGSPVPIGKYDASKASNQARTDLYNSLKRFQTRSALVIPNEFEVEFLEAKSNGEAFAKGIDLFNMFIGRSLMIPDLLGFAGSETGGGSFSLGANQMQIFYKHIERRRALLERIVNKEIVWPIVVANHGFIDNYPKFKLRPITQEQIIDSAKVWLEAVKARAWRPTDEEINHFKEIVNFPATDTDDIERIEGPEEMPTAPEAEDSDEDASPEVERIEVADGDDSTFATKTRPFKPTKGPFAAKVNFPAIEKSLDAGLEGFKATSHRLADDIFQDLKDQINRKRITQTGNLAKMETVKPRKTSKLRTLLNRELKAMYRKGQEIAQTELFKSNFAKPIVDEKFLEVIEEENINMVKDWEFAMSKNARIAVTQAIKDGKSIEDVIEFTNDKSKTSLDLYARTKMTEVMNKGRLNFFQNSNVVAGYQYSAVMDDRTTDICRGLHGKKFKEGTEPVPPMHFNCRSILVPITIFEEFKPDEKVGKVPIEGFIEDKRGAGFPKQ